MITREMEGRVNNKLAYFTDSFVKESSAGNGFDHKYFLRHGDNGNPCTVETSCPTINFWGTVFFNKPLKFGKYPDILCVREWYWQNF